MWIDFSRVNFRFKEVRFKEVFRFKLKTSTHNKNSNFLFLSEDEDNQDPVHEDNLKYDGSKGLLGISTMYKIGSKPDLRINPNSQC